MEFEHLTAYIDALGATMNIPACDFIVTVDGECVYRHFAGCRDSEGRIPMNGSEAYWVYSMTKPLTCACALKLMEDGKLALGDSVARYIPAFARWPEMTVEHLMSMRGGLDYDLHTPALEERDPSEGNLEVIARIARRELHFAPGADFMYSLCHDVLAGVIEVASGMKFGDYMKKFIWEPMGMEHTAFIPTQWHRANLCAQYIREGDANRSMQNAVNDYCFTENYQSGGAGLITTAEDYSKFVTGVVCGKLLSGKTIDIWRGHTLTGKAAETFMSMGRVGYNYALGVQVIVDTSRVRCPLGVFGWDGAAGAACMMDPENRVAIVYAQHIRSMSDVYSIVHPALRDMTYDALRGEGLIG